MNEQLARAEYFFSFFFLKKLVDSHPTMLNNTKYEEKNEHRNEFEEQQV